MTPERLASLAECSVAFDTETFLSQPGLLAPPLVCGSIARLVDPSARIIPGQGFSGLHGEILDIDQTLDAFLAILEDPKRIIVGAHIAYDMLVCAVEFQKRRQRDIFPLIFAAYEQGRVYDVLIGESLNAISDGNLGSDPRTGSDLRNPRTGKPQKYYSLEIVTDLVLGRIDAKANDEWRLKYYLLRNTPIADWPPSARFYPIDDARNTAEVALAQAGFLPKRARHLWREKDGRAVCDRCGIAPGAGMTECWVTQSHRNLHQMADQAYTAWVLHLGAAWGFNVDQKAVDAVEKEVTEVREKASVELIAAGLLKWKKDKGETKLGHSKAKIARAVAAAYGATGTCASCEGTGKVRSPSKKDPVRRAWDPERDGIGCQDCASTGFDLSTAPDLSFTDPSEKYPKGQIKADSDSLNEAGDETLRALADYEQDAKTISTYIPYLRMAQVEGRSRPLTLRPNVILETDRVSYGDAIQQFPRAGNLRSCILARKGFVLCSVDWNMGESLTHAQSCIWLLGYSDLATALNNGLDPHAALAANILGVSYEEFIERKKEPRFKAARQAAKPFTFGKPGGMGSVKLVMQQRKQGPDTPCPNGPVLVDDGEGGKVPGYRGLRFCILMEGATRCGAVKVRSWGKPGYERPIGPTCRVCLECADRLGEKWLAQWSENKPYFRLVSDATENGGYMPDGSRLAPGEVRQHVSGIIRGGVGYSDGCNGWFQSLLGVAAKRAFRRAQRECCDVSFRLPDGTTSPLLGSRIIALQHDECLAEIREGRAHDAAMRLSEIMVTTLQEVCPDLAPAVKAPPAIARRWYKGMEPVFVDERLVPWEPPIGNKIAA